MLREAQLDATIREAEAIREALRAIAASGPERDDMGGQWWPLYARACDAVEALCVVRCYAFPARD